LTILLVIKIIYKHERYFLLANLLCIESKRSATVLIEDNSSVSN
jgi:hypothetical protein